MYIFVRLVLLVSVLSALCVAFQSGPARVLRKLIRSDLKLQVQKGVSEASEVSVSSLANSINPSRTVEIFGKTKEMEKAGLTVYSLCVGEPNYQPPPEVIAATIEAANKGVTKYTAVGGTADLRTAISADLERRKSVKYAPEQIVVSNGAKQAVMQALLAVVDYGDDVIVPAPYWTSYPDMVKLCNANPVVMKTTPEDGYAISPRTLRKTLERYPKVSCIILCNPSNPTGCVMDAKTLKEIAQVLEDYPKVAVISDEIYEMLVYGEEPHVSFAAIDSMYDRTITVNGFSKSFSMTGYRVGYAAAPVFIAKAMSKLQSQMTSCASSVGQYAAHQALTNVPDSWMADRVQELKEKRDLTVSLLKGIPNVSTPPADGAFYLLPDVSAYFGKKTPDASGTIIGNSHDLCLQLLEKYQVALVPGDAFGADDCIRISYAASEDTIRVSMQKLKDFLISLVP